MDGPELHEAVANYLAHLAKPLGGQLPMGSLSYAYLMGLREICVQTGRDPRQFAAAFLEATRDITPPEESLT